MTTAAIDRPTNPTTAGGETMTAVVQEEYGCSPDTVLRVAETPLPTMGAGEVLVRVHAASVDRGTWHLMTGLPKLMRIMGFGVRRPTQPNPGRSLAGTVYAVGGDVTEFGPGDQVYGTGNGTFAEFASAQAGRLALKPVTLSFEQAAAVPVSGLTALQGVRAGADGEAGQRVLIIGASGGVGTFAVQIAKAFGAEVTGVCSTGKMELVRSLGADHVVDYNVGDFADGDPSYDVVLDIGGNSPLSRLRRALGPNGRLVIIGGETDGRWLGGFDRQLRALLLSPLVSQKLRMLGVSENAADLSVLTELLDSGRVTPAIDRTFPLKDAASAMRYFDEGHARGKVVITT